MVATNGLCGEYYGVLETEGQSPNASVSVAKEVLLLTLNTCYPIPPSILDLIWTLRLEDNYTLGFN
jgi:hypothetical protein